MTKKRVSVESVDPVEPLLDLGYKIMQIEKTACRILIFKLISKNC